MSKDTKILGTKIMKATQTGNSFNQQNSINWSYLSLGNVALNQTNKKQKMQVLRPNTIGCSKVRKNVESCFVIITGKLKTSAKGGRYPPKKRMAVIQLNNTIELYSAKKKKTKGTLECSVKKPATNSDSASCKSKGVLDVSAKIDIK